MVLTTNAQKNTVCAFAKEAPVGEPEEFGLRLCERFITSQDAVYRAQARIEQLPWTRPGIDGAPAPLSVFFTTLVGTLLALRAADPLSLDLVRACGGGRWQQLRRVQLVAALPGLFTSLKIAAPASVLGVIIGKFRGGKRGLGIAMVVAQQSLEVPPTWRIALVSGAVAGIGYALHGLVGRLVTPWAVTSAGRS